jgi:hypothetical protein
VIKKKAVVLLGSNLRNMLKVICREAVSWCVVDHDITIRKRTGVGLDRIVYLPIHLTVFIRSPVVVKEINRRAIDGLRVLT